MTKRFKLKIRRLDFISAVDAGAQGEISNVALIKRADDSTQVSATFTVAKTSPELGLVFGWAMASSLDGGATDHVDHQGDAIASSDELIKACADFMAGGGASDVMHDGEQDGQVVFMMPLLGDVKAALGVTSDVEGVAVAIKPSSETFKRFKSGELRAFSIGGEGERVPMAKAATPVMAPSEKDARIRELEQQIREAQVAKAKAAIATAAKNHDAEHTAWISGIAKSEGIAAARVVAGYNVAKAGAAPTWADRWLAANPAPAEVAKRAPESDAQVFKRRTTALEQASRAYDAGRESFAKRVNKAAAAVTGDYLATPEGAAVYAAYNKAQAALTEGEATAEELALTAEIDGLTAEIEGQTEAYSLAHDLEPMESRERLMKVSPTFAAKYKRMYAAGIERSGLIANRKAGAARIYSTGEELLAAAAEAQAAQAQKAAMMPAERKLVDHLEAIGKARGLSRAAATAWALEHDKTAQDLYNAADRERSR